MREDSREKLAEAYFDGITAYFEWLHASANQLTDRRQRPQPVRGQRDHRHHYRQRVDAADARAVATAARRRQLKQT